MRTGSNIRQRKDGRFEARYIKSRDENGKIVWGYCYGQTYEEAERKRDEALYLSVPPKSLDLLILGAGDHGHEVMELARELRLFRKISFLDDDRSKPDTIGVCRDLSRYLDDYSVAIPAVGDNGLRRRWMVELIKAGFIIPTLIHPAATVSPSAVIGSGTVVCAGATVGLGAVIGRGCIIDSGATINKNAGVPDWTWVDCGEVVHV